MPWKSDCSNMFAVRMTRGDRRESACVSVKGAGQSGVQSEWVGTTWFQRLVQKDLRFELGQVRYVLQSPQKCSCVDTERKQKKLIGTVSVRVFDVCATKLHISHEPCVRRHRFCMTTKSPTLNNEPHRKLASYTFCTGNFGSFSNFEICFRETLKTQRFKFCSKAFVRTHPSALSRIVCANRLQIAGSFS
jgi:hypothetical protein